MSVHPTTRRLRLSRSTLTRAALAAAAASTGALTSSAPAHAAGTARVDVTSLGARGDGSTDNTAAFKAAITQVEAAGGGTVYVPAGTYAFTTAGFSSVTLRRGVPVALVGAGRDSTKLVEHVPGEHLLFVSADGSSVQGITLDARTYGGGMGIDVDANHTVLAHARVLGATKSAVIGSGAVSPFALFYQGPPGASPTHPLYSVGNQVTDVDIVDGVNNDGFSFSFQADATISGVTHYGSRLALYIDRNVSVSDYTYTPNPDCLGATNAFWITSPSDGITMTNFHSSGSAGIIGAANTLSSSNITIRGEVVTGAAGQRLQIGNVTGLTITASDLGAGNALWIDPPSAATGVTVSSSKIASVQFLDDKARNSANVSASFTGDTFTPATWLGHPVPTFMARSTFSGTANLQVSGGTWGNASGGLSVGVPVAVSGLAGYRA